MEIRLDPSTTHHPQTNGQSKKTIQMLEDMLCYFILDFVGSWDEHLPLVEFAYNNSFQASIEMTPFEALYGKPYISLIYWAKPEEWVILGPKLIQETIEKIKIIQKRLKEVESR